MPRILLPESDDDRILRAAAVVAEGGEVQPVLLGEPPQQATALEWLQPQAADYADLLQQHYPPKFALDDAQRAQLLSDPTHLAALLLLNGEVDGVVTGAATTTAHVVRTALRLIKCRADTETLSSCFLMRFADGDTLLMADCALVVEPTESQLLDIAASTAANAEALLGAEPVVALLSFSTNGSADHPKAQLMARVAEALRQREPQWRVIGEIQADAALSPDIAERKGVPSPARANVLIFPDLNAANIGYKLVQRLSGCLAVGPILQGLQHPLNDLSRGASVSDIIEMIHITAKQAAHRTVVS